MPSLSKAHRLALLRSAAVQSSSAIATVRTRGLCLHQRIRISIADRHESFCASSDQAVRTLSERVAEREPRDVVRRLNPVFYLESERLPECCRAKRQMTIPV